MSWHWPWRRQLGHTSEATVHAERLRDEAQGQRSRVEAMQPRVDAATDSLRQLRSENHFGPMIEQILRGAK